MSVLSTLDKSRWAFPPPEVQGNHDYDAYAEPTGILNEMHEGKPRLLRRRPEKKSGKMR
jgi:hypothetical protein